MPGSLTPHFYGPELVTVGKWINSKQHNLDKLTPNQSSNQAIKQSIKQASDYRKGGTTDQGIPSSICSQLAVKYAEAEPEIIYSY
jgi:hypothetical protein